MFFTWKMKACKKTILKLFFLVQDFSFIFNIDSCYWLSVLLLPAAALFSNVSYVWMIFADTCWYTFIIYINNIIKFGRPMPVGKQYEVILMVPDYEMYSAQSSMV